MKNTEINLKQRFLEFRSKAGLTQKEASKLFGVYLQTWQKWEYGMATPNGAALKLLEHYEANPPEKIDISKMCKAIRNNLGLTKGNMAKFLGVDADSWGCWERGMMKPSNKHLERIEKMFKELGEKETLQKAS